MDDSSKTLLAVLAKATDDSHFLASLAEKPAEVLKDYGLNPEEHAAPVSSDVRRMESKLSTLDEPLRTLLTARLTQVKCKLQLRKG